jgi:DNA-binding NtrC family response regulator
VAGYAARVVAEAALTPVLVADDEEQLLHLCGRVLGRQGYAVLPARSGEEALSLFNRHRADIQVVVIDATISPQGALPVLEEIARLGQEVGVVFTGGDELQGPLRELLLANEGVFLRKPFPASALIRAVEDSQIREGS